MSIDNRAADPRLALLGAALLLTAACGGHEPAAPAEPAGTVEALSATAERLEVPSEVELFGTVEAETTATVSARVMARVTAVKVGTGDAVAAGQVLLTIDPQAAQGQLAQARGALAQARAGLALAERNHQRFQALAAADASSELEVDSARMQYEQALGAVEQAEGAVAAAAAVAADSRVIAPFAGRVVRKMVVMARAGLAIGQPLPVRIDARPDLGSVEATVVEMSAGADPASHSFEIKAALPVAGIPSGTSGRARVALERRAVVAIPEAAILLRGGLSLVIVADADGRTSSRVVTVGESVADGRVEVLSGLAGGETVLLDLASVPPAGARLEATRPAAESAS
jgi:multidrug efflux pump subunit AcrA (membrane-fusion protein)